MDRWNLQLPTDNNPRHIFSILFPYSELVDFTKIKDICYNNVDSLPSPHKDYYLEMLIYILNLDGIERCELFSPYNFYKIFKMPNNFAYTFFYRYEKISLEQQEILNNFKKNITKKKKELGLNHMVASFFETKLDDGVRKICEVYV